MAAANLSDAEKVTATQALLDQCRTDDFDQLKDDLAATASEVGWHDILEARSVKLQNRLSPLLRALIFMPNKRAAALLEAIDHFRNDGDLSASSAQTGFLDAEQQAAVVRDDGTFRVSLYKVFLFQAVTTAIMRKDGTFHIATPARDARDSDPLGDLFPQRHDVALAQVLETVNNHCNMLGSFEHWQ